MYSSTSVLQTPSDGQNSISYPEFVFNEVKSIEIPLLGSDFLWNFVRIILKFVLHRVLLSRVHCKHSMHLYTVQTGLF